MSANILEGAATLQRSFAATPSLSRKRAGRRPGRYPGSLAVDREALHPPLVEIPDSRDLFVETNINGSAARLPGKRKEVRAWFNLSRLWCLRQDDLRFVQLY